MRDTPPRTLLRQLLTARNLTYSRATSQLNEFAAVHGIDAAMSVRHLAGLATGERGQAGAYPETRRLLEGFFGHPFEDLIGPADPSHTQSAGGSVLLQSTAFPAGAESSVDLLSHLVTADLRDQPRIVQAPWFSDVPGIIGGYLLEPVPAKPAFPTLTPVSAESTTALLRDFTAALMDLDFRYGGGHVRRLLLHFFTDQVIPTLGEARPDADRREVFAAAAEVAQLLGWTAYDAGRHGVASRYFLQGLRLAREAEDHMLGGRLLSNLSHQANFLRKASDAVAFAQAAQSAAKGRASKTVMALLLSMEARGLATAGDETSCAKVLHKAEQIFDQRDPVADPAWISYFNESEIASEAAHCFGSLGLPEQAHEFSVRAIIPGQTPPRTEAFLQMVNASAILQRGDLDEALALATASLAATDSLQSTRYLGYVSDFKTYLVRRYPNDPRTAVFAARLRNLPEAGGVTLPAST